MSKRVALSLVAVVLALAVSSAAPAINADKTPAPSPRTCVNQCNKCGTNKVQLCNSCTGCEPCHSGTVCSI